MRVLKQQRRARIHHDKVPAHVVAVIILLAAPDLANGLANELRRVDDVSDARERGEDARGLEGAELLALDGPRAHTALALHQGSASFVPEALHLGVAHQELDEVGRVDHCEQPALQENQT